MAQVSSIEKYEVDSVSNSNLEVVMAGKADHFEHVETQDSQNDLESSQLEPISCSPMPPDSQVEEPAHHDESEVIPSLTKKILKEIRVCSKTLCD